MKVNYSLKSLVLEEDNEENPSLNPSEGEDGPIIPAETPTTPPGTISKEEAKNLIKETNGKFFTVTFIKKDGTERTMNARLGVKVYLRGGQLAYDAEEKGLIPVYDVKTKGYRMVNVSTITNLKIGRNEYTVE